MSRILLSADSTCDLGDELKEQYPNREDLEYHGSNEIDIIEARLAKPFEILRLGVPTNALTQKMFE